MKQTFRHPRPPAGKARKRARGAEGAPEAILQAAIRLLGQRGFPALTARNIAHEAGTNLALLNYHFGSKERLLLALFDTLDAERIARQRAMYAEAATTLSQKWRRAVEFYRADLADGYVRVLQELTAYGYSNARVRRRVQEHTRSWRGLLEEAASTYLPALGIGVEPAIAASAVAAFWLGMESQHLTGVPEDETHYLEILDRVGSWIEERERSRGGGSNARA